MPTRRQLIQKITLNADASSVTISNIPQNYTDLMILTSVRSNRPSNFLDTITIALNGSTSSFTKKTIYGTGTIAGSTGTANNYLEDVPATSAVANTFSSGKTYILSYSSNNFKSIMCNGVAEQNSSSTVNTILLQSSLWSNTAAITSITLGLVNSTFVANSTFYLYGITQVPIIRGGEVSVSGGFKYHTFRSTSSIQVIEPGNVECLVVAGGGGGGCGGGGGGAGGMKAISSYVGSQVSSVVVGAGGGGGIGTLLDGSNGTSSSIFGTSTTGGGGGGGRSGNGKNGGSGGGAGSQGVVGTAGTGISGEGNSGGVNASPADYGSGGGGGKGAVGSNGGSTFAGNGGIGQIWPTGSSSYYAGGGGGGMPYRTTNFGVGGNGGGGDGSGTDRSGNNGSSNTGGGGGGGGLTVPEPGRNGGSGGSGIIIIRYPYDGN